ncbi:MAG: L,D-transpeptidase [Thermomicrobiales bacterium]
MPRRSFVRGSLGLLGASVLGRGTAIAQDQTGQSDDIQADVYAAPVQPLTGGWMEVGPGRYQIGDKEVVVSLDAQRLWAYQGNDPILATFVSTGTAETPEVATPLGQFHILVKLPKETMEGTVSGQQYRVEDVPYVMYFTNEGHALHGTYWHNNFGVRMSHGCVNLPMDVAEWMYQWAPEGTPVTIVP